MARKQLWLLAGGNNAGKSAFYRLQLAKRGIPFVNSDILANQRYPIAPEAHSYDAAMLAAQIQTQLVLDGRSFCFETVFSHPSKVDFVAQAKSLGYETILVFIHLDNEMLNLARISQRVSEGGHFVPEEKVRSRIPRTLKLIKRTMPLCDQCYLLDNSRADNPLRPGATIRQGRLELKQDSIPEWAKALLADYLPAARE